MRIAICEDIEIEAKELEAKIRIYMDKTEHNYSIDVFNNAESFEKSRQVYDIVFLDYDLPDKNGLDVAKKLRIFNKKVVIIFVTAYDAYVYESFEVNTFRYLLKPVEYSTIEKTMNGFFDFYESQKTLIVKDENKTIILNLDEVIYIESASKRSLIVTLDKSFDVSMSISSIQAQINSASFFRTHRRFIVNMKYITEINRNTIILTNGHHALISRNNLQNFNKVYMNYLKFT